VSEPSQMKPNLGEKNLEAAEMTVQLQKATQ